MLTNSTLSGNSANSFGGGIYNKDASSNLQIDRSTFSGNSANNGGAIANFDISNPDGSDPLLLRSSTMASNTVNLDGGALYNGGSVIVENTTFSSNSAGRDGGGALNKRTMTIGFSTFHGNAAVRTGGGIATTFTSAIDPTSSEVSNTIVAASTNGDCEGNGTFVASNNLATGSCGSVAVAGLDGSLLDNGGPTLTHAVPAESNAVDAAVGECPPTDQRGQIRPIDGDDDGTPTCDIGAFEFAPFVHPPTPIPGSTPLGWIVIAVLAAALMSFRLSHTAATGREA